MKYEDRVSYVMLFCALMMVRNAQATVDQSLQVVPLSERAKRLACEIGSEK